MLLAAALVEFVLFYCLLAREHREKEEHGAERKEGAFYGRQTHLNTIRH